MRYSTAELGFAIFPEKHKNRLFVAQRGSITGVNPGTIFALSSLPSLSLKSLASAVGWARWIRPVVRYKERREREASFNGNHKTKSRGLVTRPNLALADISLYQESGLWSQPEPNFRGILQSIWPKLNVVELFAGAGGMGLGFLMANSGRNPYELAFSGEVNPIYVQTLKQNHKSASKIYAHKANEVVPVDVVPTDLRDDDARTKLDEVIKEKGGIQILIGGPPCQGFSSSNRNSGGGDNPNNKLFNVFLDYVEYLKPAIFLLENVQGVAWAKSQRRGKGNLLNHLNYRMEKAGYFVSQKLLDAVWYGAPQYRYRFFAVGIRNDLGYTADDFGEWGPYPSPTHGPHFEHEYVTVDEAIRELPKIGNGYNNEYTKYKPVSASKLCKNPFLQSMRHGSHENTISDHVTSRHADYVIKRYESIPEGGNWESIKGQMTNYANVSRTHSNIYRRLKWNEPSITIGHYRKSMLIHPNQNRGLSWREAARLQSFPDWVRFAGRADDELWNKGLAHKQQQLANAVCPLLTKAVAEFILKL